MEDMPYNKNYVIFGKQFVNSTNVNDIPCDVIPKHIVFFYDYINLVPNKVFDNWKKLNPDYKIIFFSFEDAEYFLNIKFGKMYVNYFNKIIHPPHKCDFFRLCFIYIYGGIYSDIDNVPVEPLEEFFKPYSEIKFLSCISYSKQSFAQAIIISIKQNNFIQVCIQRYVREFLKLEHLDNYLGAALAGTKIMHDEIKKIFISNNSIKDYQIFRAHKKYTYYDRYVSNDRMFKNTLVLLDEFSADGNWLNCYMRTGYKTVLKSRYNDYPWFGKNNN